jgi:hypothetical protein
MWEKVRILTSEMTNFTCPLGSETIFWFPWTLTTTPGMVSFDWASRRVRMVWAEVLQVKANRKKINQYFMGGIFGKGKEKR